MAATTPRVREEAQEEEEEDEIELDQTPIGDIRSGQGPPYASPTTVKLPFLIDDKQDKQENEIFSSFIVR